MSGKVETSANKMVYVRIMFSRNIVLYLCQASKLQHVCNRLNISFCTKDHKTSEAIENLNRLVLKQINSNLDGLSRDSPPFPHQNYEFHNYTLI